MNCDTCRGACCEDFSIRVEDLRVPNLDVARWLVLHASETPRDWTTVQFECPCRQLTSAGRCRIYETRPDVCRIFTAGGTDCLATVRVRRTAAEYAMIRGDHDPVEIHEKGPSS